MKLISYKYRPVIDTATAKFQLSGKVVTFVIAKGNLSRRVQVNPDPNSPDFYKVELGEREWKRAVKALKKPLQILG